MAITIDRRRFITLLGSATSSSLACAQPRPARILFFTHSAGYRHDVISLSQTILEQIGKSSGMFEVTGSEDVAEFTVENLQRYDAVMFFTTGELPLSGAQKAAFIGFVRSGHGFVGVHSATDTYYDWPDYLALIGGYFDGHPWHQKVRVRVADPSNSLVSFIGPSLELNDEIYQIRDFDEGGSRVLLRLDDSSVDLTREGVHRRSYGWPMAWTRSYGEGRVFYTALGHEAAVWQDERYQRLLLNAILWSSRASP